MVGDERRATYMQPEPTAEGDVNPKCVRAGCGLLCHLRVELHRSNALRLATRSGWKKCHCKHQKCHPMDRAISVGRGLITQATRLHGARHASDLDHELAEAT